MGDAAVVSRTSEAPQEQAFPKWPSSTKNGFYLESEIDSEYNFEDIVGKSAALRKVLDQVAIVAPTQSTVLLHGETGTGKELVRPGDS